MSTAKRVTLLIGIVLLATSVLIGCSVLLKDGSGQSRKYLKLNINPPTTVKAIAVTEYDVTDLDIQVYDPLGVLLTKISWNVAEGRQSYLIPVSEQEGEHEIVVTHISNENGEVVEAEESAAFNIQAMFITVIDIIPGRIGVIYTSPGGEEQPFDPLDWIIDYWLDEIYTAPHTPVLEINEDGTFFWWEYYNGTGDSEDNGTWSFDGDVLTIDAGYGPEAVEITKYSDDHFSLVMGDEVHLYRRGTEPGGWIFDKTPTALTVSTGEWTVGTIATLKMKLFSFEAPDDGSYAVSWTDSEMPDPMICDAVLMVSVYEDDQENSFFVEVESGYSSPQTLDLAAGQTIYIIIHAWEQGGTFGIRVMQQ